MTQASYERQHNARTSCSGQVSDPVPSEGFFEGGRFFGTGSSVVGGLGGVVFVLAVVVAIVSVLKLNKAHRIINELSS